MKFKLIAEFSVPDEDVEEFGLDIIKDNIWDDFVAKGNDKYFDWGDVYEVC